jgi:hypothetical protein
MRAYIHNFIFEDGVCLNGNCILWEDHQNLQQQIHYARTKWRLMYLVGDIGGGLTGFGWIWWCELDHRILVRFGKAKICKAGWNEES